MKNAIKVGIIVLINIILICNVVMAASVEAITDEQSKEIVNGVIQSFGEEGLTKDNLLEAITQYKELSKEYTNEDIARIIEENRAEFEQHDISKENIDTMQKVLKNFDEKQINNVLDKLDIDEALSELESGATILELMQKTTENMSAKDKANVLLSIIWSATLVQVFVWLIIAFELYKLIIRAIIFRKAGEKGWAVLIPIYRDVVMLRICGMSPLWLLLLFVPVIGWALLWIVKVASRFMLAEAFDKGAGFGFGLWLLWPIFEGILALSTNCKYVGIN